MPTEIGRPTRREFLKTALGAGATVIGANALPPLVRAVFPGIGFGTVDTAEAAEPYQPADIPLIPPGEEHPGVPPGWFFTQTRGTDKPYPMGYILYNKDDVPMWSLYQQWGGREKFGIPITDRYQTPQGTWIQLFQTGGAEWNPTTKEFGFVNGFDVMERAGIKLDQTWYKIPNSREGVWNPNLPWGHNEKGPLPGTIEANQINRIFSKEFLPNVPADKIKALKEYYLRFPDWFDRFGLPTGIDYYPNEDILSVRTQRASIQSRKTPLPGSTLQPYEPVAIYATQAMRDYAKDTGSLVPREALEAKYNPYGVGGGVETPQEAAQEAMNLKLQGLLDYTVEENGQKYPNALGLDPQEVARYIADPSKEANLTSFRVLKNKVGHPLAILVTGGRYGLKTEKPNIANIQAAINRLNEIDPETFNVLTNKFGLRAITNEIAPGNIWSKYDYGTTYIDKNILFNEKAQDVPVNAAITYILVESRGIYNRQNLAWNGSKWVYTAPDKLDEHDGVDKCMWLEQWIELHKTTSITDKTKFTPEEYRDIKELADAWLQYYQDVAKNAA